MFKHSSNMNKEGESYYMWKAGLSRGRGSVNPRYPLLSETLMVWNGQMCHQECCAVTGPHTYKNQEL